MVFGSRCVGALVLVLAAQSEAWAAVAVPVFNPAEGDSAVVFPLIVSCATSGATIRYTLNGSEPTLSDPVIASQGTITIARKLTVKAKAWYGGEESAIATADFNLTGDVAAGSHHVLSLSTTGVIKAWGAQASGRLGNGLTGVVDVTSPTASKYDANTPITDAIAIAAGQNHSLFIKRESGANGVVNSVYSFGNNSSGELGNDTTSNQSYAVHVLKSSTTTDYLTNCWMVRAGENFSGALGMDGKVYMWGSQAGGRLGNGSTSTLVNQKTAVNVKTVASGNPQLTDVVSISLGSGFGLARQVIGTKGYVWSWGQGASGRLGQGNTNNKEFAGKVQLPSPGGDLEDAWDIGAGGSHGVVVRRNSTDQNGTVWTFGDGTAGRLGNNATSDSLLPVQVKRMNNAGTVLVNLDEISMVAAGSAHTLALDSLGAVWAWGYNGFGALGDNSTTNKSIAIKVLNPSGSGQLGTTSETGKIVWISAGGDGNNNTSYAISEKGTIYAWGRNDNGEMANGGNTGYVTKPAAVSNLQVIPNYPDVALAHNVTTATAPGSVNLTATPSDLDGPGDIKRVEFYSQGALVGTKTASPWQLSLSGLAVGNYHVYAVVTDQANNQGQSAPITFSITINPNSDDDHDGLTYAAEVSLGTDPSDPDSDNDGMGDGYEAYYDLDPLHGGNNLGLNKGPAEHKDTDGLTNKDESDRGRIPTSATESPAITGTHPALVAKWFGVEGVTYHFEYSIDQINWTRPTAPFVGHNAELSLALSTVISPLPTTFHTRLVTVSDAPDVTLSSTVTAPVEPGAATLTAVPSDANGSGDIASVRFYFDGLLAGTKTSAPWTWPLPGLTAGSHTARAVVTDQGGKRGFSADIGFLILSPNPDSDSDGLPDAWERTHFNSLSATGSGDADDDGLTNFKEYELGTKPTLPDTDNDGMGDGYEEYYALNPSESVNGLPSLLGPEDDRDLDTLANKDEFDRGLIPTSDVESPLRSGTPPHETLEWWGVEGIVYHIDYASVVSMAGAIRSSYTVTGSNAKIVVPLSSVVSPVPSTVYFRLATDSDVPVVSLAVSYPSGDAPKTVTLTPMISNPLITGNIRSVEFYLDGIRKGLLTVPPFIHAEPSAAAGTHQAQVVVTDVQGRRGWSEIDAFTLTAPAFDADTDLDGLWDSWEMTHFGTLAFDASDDADGDGLTNLQEFTRAGGATNPMLMDTDGDGLPDGSDTNPLAPAEISVPNPNGLRILTPAQH